MRHLNYTHLLYFWTVAREGSIATAAESLNLTPQTISGQIKLLEESVGSPLFVRAGRGLVITETGQLVKQYADEIFALGAELTHRVKTDQALVPNVLNIGIVDSIPKLIGLRIIEPVLSMQEKMRVVCRQGSLEELLGQLGVHRLDVIVSDRPLSPGMNVKAYSHTLGETTVSLFCHQSIANVYTSDFPDCLQGAPFLMPVNESAVRRALEQWMDSYEIHPDIVVECEDSALLKAFGEAAYGVFPAPTAIKEEICSMYDAEMVAELDTVAEKFYAISPERKLKHPAVLEVINNSRDRLFS